MKRVCHGCHDVNKRQDRSFTSIKSKTRFKQTLQVGTVIKDVPLLSLIPVKVTCTDYDREFQCFKSSVGRP